MTILNIMLGHGRGGLEQAAIDYALALTQAGYHVVNICAPKSWAAQELGTLNLAVLPLSQHGGWDVFAAWKLKNAAHKNHARALLCHGNRAVSLALLSKARARIIGVAHNQKIRRFPRVDAALGGTQEACDRLQQNGVKNVHLIPNMVHAPAPAPRPPFRTPPVIGAMGRFSPEKGFEIFLDALAILKKEGVAFQATLGGDGPEYNRLHQQMLLNELEHHLTLPRWVHDKAGWFHGIDIFVLPSHTESFGLVLLEAMAAGVPVIAADAVGPRSILAQGDGLLFPRGEAAILSKKIKELMSDQAAAQALGQRGQQRVSSDYTLAAMSTRLKTALTTILTHPSSCEP